MDNAATIYKNTVTPSYVLKVIKGYDEGKEYELFNSEEYKVGREDCNISINQRDRSASRQHAVLKINNNKLCVRNLSATNGTVVNGKTVKKRYLKNGDELKIGSTIFKVIAGDTDFGSSKAQNMKLLRISSVLILSILITIIAVKFIRTPKSQAPNLNLPIVQNNQSVKDTKKTVTAVSAVPSSESELTKTENQFPAKLDNIIQPESQTPNPIPSAQSEPVTKSETVSPSEPVNTQIVQELFEEGKRFYEIGDLKSAIQKWTEAQKNDPADKTIQARLENAEKELNNYIAENCNIARKHKQYLRNDEALIHYNIILQLAIDKNSDCYKEASEQVKQLGGM